MAKSIIDYKKLIIEKAKEHSAEQLKELNLDSLISLNLFVQNDLRSLHKQDLPTH